MVKQKDCVKGFNCGAACIEKQDNCTKNVSDNITKVVESMTAIITTASDKKKLEGNVNNLANMIANGEMTDDEIDAAVGLYGSILQVSKPDRTAFFMPSYDDIKGMTDSGMLDKYAEAYNKSFEGREEKNPDVNAPGGIAEFTREVAIRKDISDEAAKAVYESLPAKVKTKLNKAGDPRGGFWQGKFNEDGSPVIGGKATKTRGEVLLKRYLEQDGVDPYDGKKLNIMEAELEHIIPENRGGEQAEQPNNWMWISAKNNKWHDTMSGDEWKENAKNALSDKEAYEKNYEKAKAASADKNKKVGKLGGQVKAVFDPELGVDEKVKMAEKISNDLGAKSYKLVSEMGVKSSFEQPRPDRATEKKIPHRTSNVDTRQGVVQDVLGTKEKPSTLVAKLLAKKSNDPDFDEVKKEFDTMMSERAVPKPEAVEIYNTKGPDAYKEALEAKDVEFAEKLKPLLEKHGII